MVWKNVNFNFCAKIDVFRRKSLNFRAQMVKYSNFLGFFETILGQNRELGHEKSYKFIHFSFLNSRI